MIRHVNDAIESVKVAMGHMPQFPLLVVLTGGFSKNLLSLQQTMESVAGLIINNCRKKVYTICYKSNDSDQKQSLLGLGGIFLTSGNE